MEGAATANPPAPSMRRARALVRRAADVTGILGARVFWTAPAFVLRPSYLVLVRELRSALPPAPDATDIRWTGASAENIAALVAADPRVSEAEAHRRLEQGQEGLLEWIGESLAHYRWYATGATYLPYLDREIRLHAGDVLTERIFTAPAFRRRGIHASASLTSLRALQKRGFERSICLCAWWNTPALRVERDRAGAAVVGSIGCWKLRRRRRYFTRGAVRLEAAKGFRIERTASFEA